MKKRLLIGVIACETEQLMQRRLMKGISAQAFSLDMDVAVFSCITNSLELTPHQSSECNIFNYMNFQLLDGILYLRNSIHAEETKRRLDRMLAEQKIPVLVLDTVSEQFPYLTMDDRAGFAAITEHLLGTHGLTDLICLTGPESNQTAVQRVLGFRDAMEAHHLSVSDENIIYGDYWYGSAKALAAELISGKRKMPQGVVCGNDPMAKALCHELIANGVRIPEDVVVTGYDASLTEAQSLISLTSYVRRNFRLGAQGVQKLYQMMTGETCALTETERIGVITGDSCPCGTDLDYLKHQIRVEEQLDDYRTMFRTSNMGIQVTRHETLDSCMDEVRKNIYLIRGVAEYYLCLCEDWEGGGALENPSEYRREGFPQHMLLKILHNSSEHMVCTKPFPSAKMLPRLHEEREKPATFFFSPVHHDDRFFGVSVTCFGERLDTYDNIYCEWIAMVNTALEFVRMQNYLKRFNNRIYLSSIRDALTGLYNRTGYEKFSEECFTAAKNEHRRFLLLYAGFDSLRQINETYGHSEGDSAVTVLANAMNNSCTTYERCARIEDADFAIVGYQDYEMDACQRMMYAVSGYLEHYNQSSRKPYKLSASFGFFCDYIPDGVTLDDIRASVTQQIEESRASRQSEKASPYYREFVSLRERIYSNPQEDWSIDSMCRDLILSRGYFQKLYTRCFGISFTQDVINSRIELSKRLLSSTDYSIAYIADQSGYSNYVHFMHQFKKNVGITPTEYRRRKRQGEEV
ncbi:MAG: substrate-binding domain-containing protein [Oscillospiraceae bacterium]|nr:substrate-binding domain-containing protein [Oscillospiraceae bacterium]